MIGPNAAANSLEKGSWAKVRDQFPALNQSVDGLPLVYLDSAATTLTPQPVIDAIADCYARGFANVNRGAHRLSELATHAYEEARETACDFLHARFRDELVFVRGCTEALNLVAQSWGNSQVGPGDQVVVCEDAHHSNWLPWQQLCERRGAKLRVVPLNAAGRLDLDAYAAVLTEHPRMVALTHVSNSLGAVNPVREMTAQAQAAGAAVMVDGAQAVSHFSVDVQEIGCDFYAFSTHKLYGPFGMGVLFAKRPHLTNMPVWMTGGGMVQEVAREQSVFVPPPAKFEPGTPNVAGAVGLKASLNFIQSLGWSEITTHEAQLLEIAERSLDTVPGLTRLGGEGERSGVISIVLQGVHPHDLSTILDSQGVAVRAGHHCAKPALRRLGVEATTRISLGIYNKATDIEALRLALLKAREIFLP